MPVMGILFLRHAHFRYLSVKPDIEAILPSRSGKTRALTKEDFSSAGAIFLRPEAQYDHLVALPDKTDRAKAIIDAMESIESDYHGLKGVLPKAEFNELSNEVLGSLLRKLNPEELKNVEGDVFGRIYEYFLTRFAGDKAHDGGEFFTPVSLVSFIANAIEVDSGTIIDPACGSGGMFVRSADLVKHTGRKPSEKLTFLGMEKNATTIRLAKMNLTVHGLEGDIQQANTYYEDPHNIVGKADGLMANPPFNVDEIDALKIKADGRLNFGLPGVSPGTKKNPEKKGKITTAGGNYVWISYFHSYLKPGKGKGGFVMPSSASSASNNELTIRRKLIETGDVDAVVSIRGGFFYTRTVPCELWFLDRGKPKHRKDKLLLIDARGISRKVTRTVYDFSPEQERNLLSILWLYRGESERFLELVSDHCQQCVDAVSNLIEETGDGSAPLTSMTAALEVCFASVEPFIDSLREDCDESGQFMHIQALHDDVKTLHVLFKKLSENLVSEFAENEHSNKTLNEAVTKLSEIAKIAKQLFGLRRIIRRDLLRLIKSCENNHNAKKSDKWETSKIKKSRLAFEDVIGLGNELLLRAHYFNSHAKWLTERFPDAKLCDVLGLVKLVDRAEIKNNDWSLAPGRYVGLTPPEVEEDFDFSESMERIHIELDSLNEKTTRLAMEIQANLERFL